MIRHFAIHIKGAAFAILAFILGSQFAKNTAPPLPVKNGTASDLTASSPQGVDSETADALGRQAISERESPLVDLAFSTSAPLTSETIARLGDLLRTSLDPIERRLAFAKLLKGLTLENAAEIREQLAHLGPGSDEFRDFHHAWGKLAGAEAVLAGGASEVRSMVPALAGWASANPRAALQWFSTLDIANDPNFAYLLNDRGIPSDRLRNDLLKGLVSGVAAADIDLAASYAYDLAAAGDAQAKAMMQMITGKMIESRGLEHTRDWASRLPEGRMQGAATEKLVQTWGKTDITAAHDWARNLGLEYGGGSALSAVYGFWGAGAKGTDPLIASQAINDMPDSLSRDFIINGFISGLRWSDPQGAVIWAQDISNPHIREAAVVRAAETYANRDPAGYTQWLATSNLPESTRQKLSHRFPK